MLGQTIAAAAEPQADPLPVFPNPPQVAEVVQPVPAPLPPVPEPSFNFLQESQIDLESPHMDPAVVMIHPPKRTAEPGRTHASTTASSAGPAASYHCTAASSSSSRS